MGLAHEGGHLGQYKLTGIWTDFERESIQHGVALALTSAEQDKQNKDPINGKMCAN